MGLLSETFDRGPIIVTYTREKGGQFKESLDKTAAATTKQSLWGGHVGTVFGRRDTDPIPLREDKEAHPRSSPAPVIHKHEKGPHASPAWLGTRGTGTRHTIDPVTWRGLGTEQTLLGSQLVPSTICQSRSE